jgi:NADH:ubiquinone reductase (non-electrogenic)
MSSPSRAVRQLAVPRTGAVLLRQSTPSSSPRLLLQASQRIVGVRPTFSRTQSLVSTQFRRAASTDAGPAPKKKRFRTLRWIWRLTYLSFLGGLVYVGYRVYEDRHLEPQTEPDPNKKTLVILGTSWTIAKPPMAWPSSVN